jgi:hypothetical protein
VSRKHRIESRFLVALTIVCVAGILAARFFS